MPRYIDAEAFEKDILERHCEPCKRENKEFCLPICGYWHMIKGVRDAPTADVQEVRHAHWTSDGHCSGCGMLSYGFYRNFCPCCGAKMDEKEKENDDHQV